MFLILLDGEAEKAGVIWQALSVSLGWARMGDWFGSSQAQTDLTTEPMVLLYHGQSSHMFLLQDPIRLLNNAENSKVVYVHSSY